MREKKNCMSRTRLAIADLELNLSLNFWREKSAELGHLSRLSDLKQFAAVAVRII